MSAKSNRAERLRVWEPGKLWLSTAGEFVLGPGAGLTAREPAFEGVSLCQRGSLDGLRHHIWLVRRADLTSDIVDEHALILAEELIDADKMPCAKRWLEQQPAVAISGDKRARLLKAGVRVWHVAVEKGTWTIEGDGGDGPRVLLKLDVAAAAKAQRALLARSALKYEQTPRSAPSVVDRLLRHFSDDGFNEASCFAALRVREVCTPGYGYHGATDGHAATVAQVQRALAPVEAIFQQIYPRAKEQEERVSEVLDELSSLRQSEGSVERSLLDYGTLQVHREDELELRKGALREYRLDGERATKLVLPAYNRWFASEWTPWGPAASSLLAASGAASVDEEKAPSQVRVLAVVLVLVALTLAAYFLR